MSTLTAREQQLIALGLQCYDTQPKIDYAKLAELSGLKNASTASVMYGGARRKLLSAVSKSGDSDDVDPQELTTPTKKKGTPRKRKTAAPKAGGDIIPENEEDGATETTPKPKRVRKTPVKKGAKSPANVKEENSDPEATIDRVNGNAVKDEPVESPGLSEAEPKLENTDEPSVKVEFSD